MSVKEQRRGMVLQNFLEADPLLRHTQFQNLQEGQIKPILSQWVKDPDFRLTELLLMPDPFRHWGVKMVKNSGRSFYLKTNPMWEPPPDIAEAYGKEWVEKRRAVLKFELPLENNQRDFAEVSGAFTQGAKVAIQLINCFGEHASNIIDRGRVLEITEDEYYDEVERMRSKRNPTRAKGKSQPRA